MYTFSNQRLIEEEGNIELGNINLRSVSHTRRSTFLNPGTSTLAIELYQQWIVEQAAYDFFENPYPNRRTSGRADYSFVDTVEEDFARRVANDRGSSQAVTGIPVDNAIGVIPNEIRRIPVLDAGLLHHARVFEHHDRNIRQTYQEIGLLRTQMVRERGLREQVEQRTRHLEWALGVVIVLVAALLARVSVA